MASQSFFLGGIDLTGVTLARVDEREAIATYTQFIEEVRARCGADVASLFAEPIKGASRSTGIQNVTWYCDVEGTPFLLRQLDPRGRQPVVDLLKQRLRSFSSLLSDPKSGAGLGSWLYVLSPDSIMAVSGQPVIKNWGMLPVDVAASDEARDTHFRNTIGLYLPNVPTPPFSEMEGQSFAGRMRQLAERETARAAPPPLETPGSSKASAVLPSVTAPAPASVLGRPAWHAPAIASGVAALVLVLLVFGHVLRYPGRQILSDDQAIDAQRQTNKVLQERLDQLKRESGKVCEAPGNGRGSANLPPLLPPSPTQTKVTANEPGRANPEVRSLGTVLSKATVLVRAGDTLGSGFFISDRYIVTNHHVVGDALNVEVGNKTIGGLIPGRVVAVGAGREKGTQDIAIIEVSPQQNVAFLKIGITPDQLSQVTAAGFPGAVLETIENLDHNLPEPNFTQGIVTQRQEQQPAGVETIIHTAQIGHGNSGGPLVDPGGCVVGMNSWANFDEIDHVIFTTYFQAFDASEIRKFLTAKTIGFTGSDTACSPVNVPPVASTQPTPAPPPRPDR